MSKQDIIFIGDWHIGGRNGSDYFREFVGSYFLEYFIPWCVDNKIKHVVQAGDATDAQTTMKTKDIDFINEVLIPAFREAGIELTILCGNHDVALRKTNKITTLTSIRDTETVKTVIEKPEELIIGGHKVLVVPWINEENYNATVQALKETNADYCVGHFEFAGFPMYSNTPLSDRGTISADLFKKFKAVWSGHFHCRSKSRNIEYLGSPYHITWSDAIDGTNRGFTVLKADGASYNVDNEDFMTLFAIIEYNKNEKYAASFFEAFEGNIVKVIVNDKEESQRNYKKFIRLLQATKLISHQIEDNTIRTTSGDDKPLDKETLSVDPDNSFMRYIESQREDSSVELKAKFEEIVREVNE